MVELSVYCMLPPGVCEQCEHCEHPAIEGMSMLHRDVEVTDAEGEHRPVVSQAFCSALPVAYTGVSSAHWRPFAALVLDAAYEATMLAAVLNKQRRASNVVLLTFLGGGVFGNEGEWINAAIR